MQSPTDFRPATAYLSLLEPATDGFDIHVADPSLGGGVLICPNDKQPYYIDWVVVRK